MLSLKIKLYDLKKPSPLKNILKRRPELYNWLMMYKHFILFNYKIFKVHIFLMIPHSKQIFCVSNPTTGWLYNQYCRRQKVYSIKVVCIKDWQSTHYFYHSVSCSKEWWLTLLSSILKTLKRFYPLSYQAHHSPELYRKLVS